jgi:RNA polymerase sigma factor (sigma-70 family)
MDDHEWISQRFEANRARLRAVAYRMLGSRSEADDAVQEAWLRLSRSDTGAVENLDGWLTTVVARVCLNMLRSRKSRREEPLDVSVPDPIVSRRDGVDPADEALLADSVGLALCVVLETLAPPERLAFVLHDMFAVPFDDIAAIVGRSATATRKLASRARRRVQGSQAYTDPDISKQRAAVDAFLAASRDGSFDALVAILHPDVVLRADYGPRGSKRLQGAKTVAEQAFAFSRFARFAQPALVNNAAGLVAAPGGRPLSVMGFTVDAGGKIVAIDVLADPARLRELDLPMVDG